MFFYTKKREIDEGKSKKVFIPTNDKRLIQAKQEPICLF